MQAYSSHWLVKRFCEKKVCRGFVSHDLLLVYRKLCVHNFKKFRLCAYWDRECSQSFIFSYLESFIKIFGNTGMNYSVSPDIMSVSNAISDLLWFVSYFASQSKESLAIAFLMCVV